MSVCLSIGESGDQGSIRVCSVGETPPIIHLPRPFPGGLEEGSAKKEATNLSISLQEVQQPAADRKSYLLCK